MLINGVVLYLPAAHCEHVPPVIPAYPSGHVQVITLILPAGERLFDGHSEQGTGPTASLYSFIIHGEHAAPFAPVYPALHSHVLFMVLPAREIESEGQDTQEADPNTAL